VFTIYQPILEHIPEDGNRSSELEKLIRQKTKKLGKLEDIRNKAKPRRLQD
jgi:hypothetical protein